MQYNSKNLEYAKQLRSNMTPQETKLWKYIRAGRLQGYKFKRQVLIGSYIVDFVCHEKKLIIELDGGQHNEEVNIEYDNMRTEYLNKEGYFVLRFWNNEIDKNINGVLSVILRGLETKRGS